LVQATKKNMERMAEAVPDSNDQAFQHFLTNSPWDEQLVVEQVAHDANELLGGVEIAACCWTNQACRKKATSRLAFPGNGADNWEKPITARSVSIRLCAW
jgi:SRSO17 transposase